MCRHWFECNKPQCCSPSAIPLAVVMVPHGAISLRTILPATKRPARAHVLLPIIIVNVIRRTGVHVFVKIIFILFIGPKSRKISALGYERLSAVVRLGARQ